ncbi:hypothetical protein HJC23_005412 [Cyclotella cryptica]|uniref:Uncharacterized protein n=1 Tax=Cyclotella cryptica TaxID=29204 RepID=A0ABD3P1H0_9STRA
MVVFTVDRSLRIAHSGATSSCNPILLQKAAFDEIYIMNYVFGSFGYHGKEAMNKYHLLSHFHQVDFANPIAPLHADDSFRDILATTGAEGLAPSAVIHSMYPRAADGPLMRQNMNAHHHKRRQVTVPV